MIATIEYKNNTYKVDLSRPIDISIPLGDKEKKASAWYCSDTEIKPVVMEGFVGAVAQGGSVNFRNISFNPHGNGTHTECVGHIAEEVHSVNKHFKQYHCFAQVSSITPKKQGEDLVIDEILIKDCFDKEVDAVIIRTLPNTDKIGKNYTETNPPYITVEAIQYLNQLGIKHLLIDLPSVDREVDGGALAAHRAFWNYPENPWYEKTITEFIYVDKSIEDGLYFLNIMVAPFENDATPSKPILYPLL